MIVFRNEKGGNCLKKIKSLKIKKAENYSMFRNPPPVSLGRVGCNTPVLHIVIQVYYTSQ